VGVPVVGVPVVGVPVVGVPVVVVPVVVLSASLPPQAEIAKDASSVNNREVSR
jgi:hypothetical protein